VVEGREVALEINRIEQSRLEVAHGSQERVGEAAESGRAAEAVHPRADRRDGPSRDQRLLGVRGDRAGLAAAPRDRPEHVVERPDRPAEERRLELDEVALGLLHVRPVGHDQHRLARQDIEVPAQEQRDLPGIRRAGDQGQTHRLMLLPP
jgi:hypothetical protein